MEPEYADKLNKFITNWNVEFPDYCLTVADLKRPSVMIGALQLVLDRIGVDSAALLKMSLPEEEWDEHTIYYWDLMPVINMTRVINQVISVIPQAINFNMTQFLQPTLTMSHSLLLLVFNLMLFYEDRQNLISPDEEELFNQRNQVKALEDKKNDLLKMLNDQAQEKAKIAEQMEQLEREIHQTEIDCKVDGEKDLLEKQKLKAELDEEHQLKVLLEQKRGQRDAMLAEVAKKKALRVYDADDIKAQVEQAAQNVQEVEERHDSLKATLMQKEISLKNLQTIKPILDTANNVLHEIMRLTESLKELESSDLDSESADGELEVLATERLELNATIEELRAARKAKKEISAARRERRARMDSVLREAEERDRKGQERHKKSLQRIEQIKQLISQYEREKAAGFEDRDIMVEQFRSQVKSFEDAMISKSKATKKQLEDKQLR